MAVRDLYAWQAADGRRFPLNDATGLRVLLGVEGRGEPPSRRVESTRSGMPGALLIDVEHDVRDVNLPVLLISDAGGEAGLQALARAWAARMDPKLGDGMLVCTTAGAQRSLRCRLAGGMEILELGQGIPRRMDLTFRAVDPYWYGSIYSAVYTTSTPTVWFPILPLRLSGSTVFAQPTIDSDADVECWPVWTITGPGTDPELSDLTTGATLAFDGLTLTAGESVTIDTSPGIKSVVDDEGISQFALLTPESELWPIAPGSNAVELVMGGATTDSSIAVSFPLRFLTS